MFGVLQTGTCRVRRERFAALRLPADGRNHCYEHQIGAPGSLRSGLDGGLGLIYNGLCRSTSTWLPAGQRELRFVAASPPVAIAGRILYQELELLVQL